MTTLSPPFPPNPHITLSHSKPECLPKPHTRQLRTNTHPMHNNTTRHYNMPNTRSPRLHPHPQIAAGHTRAEAVAGIAFEEGIGLEGGSPGVGSRRLVEGGSRIVGGIGVGCRTMSETLVSVRE
ncbi:hypothetical protein SAICODRAFT_200050 [Saitoella complicata NRRL Y-17804]|uniref:uncharacterized protein n=1 Tax=Saitoella complicata (strain BCRC 22490 / CBS 7301 / JCM 7358 / NBRC 10748 / NRRL Y-17804) TaxID=698492 RepID=UPI000866DCAB|nr:uncharacterized protein SAICODRAFT_200050 [Saitoella complicata NRRL Y-17804]ODQ55140.1 hypothetical protein SAICODRAFT_200050 [Saitoella complicata NRRL Y-17804]